MAPLLAAVLLSGCALPWQRPQPAVPVRQVPQPIHVGFWQAPAGPVTPFAATANQAAQAVVQLLYEPLLRLTDKGWQPELASGYSVSADGKQVTFTLRQGAKWSDGQPITADDVVFTYQYLLSPGYDGPGKDALLLVAGAPSYRDGKAPTVSGIASKGGQIVVTLTRPDGATFSALAGTAIVPKHVWSQVKPADAGSAGTVAGQLVADGPFRFASLENGVLRLTPNPNYWGALPKADLLLEAVDKPTSADVKASKPDLVAVDPAQGDALEKEGLRLLRAGLPQGVFLAFNLRTAGLAEVSARAALLKVIEPARLAALQGRAGMALGTFFGSGYWAGIGAAAANATGTGTVAQPAGLDALKGVKLLVRYPEDDAALVKLGERVVQALKGAGLAAEGGPLKQEQFAPFVFWRHDFDLALFRWPLEGEPEPNLTRLFGPQYGNGWDNLSGYEPAASEKLLEEARRTTDPAKRTALYPQWQAALAKDLPVVPVYQPSLVFAANPALQGLPQGDVATLTELWLSAPGWVRLGPEQSGQTKGGG